ncbi:MAG: AmmeMemoRadiSam system protein A [Selenomonadaceae bacterium]|nr:AmmeMemoRadiSam system protein A [Selenomonadaceae bacterium]
MSILAAVAVPHPPLIMPEVGRGQEKTIQKTIDAYREVMAKVAALKPDTVVVLSPHSVMYADYFHISPGKTARGDFGAYRAPEASVTATYDAEFRAALIDRCQKTKIPAGTLGEKTAALDHATMIPLRFLQEHRLQCKYLRIGLAGLPAREHYRLGTAIAEAAAQTGKRAVIIASGDLSHKLKADGPYGFVPEGPEFDRLAMEALGKGDFFSLLIMDKNFTEKAAECGLRSFWIMAGAFDGHKVAAKALSYEGPFGVGYGVAWFKNEGEDDSRFIGEQLAAWQTEKLNKIRNKESEPVRLARESLESFIREGKEAALPTELSPELIQKRAGAFVSLKKDGELRGCIGTFLPTASSLAAEIRQNALSAGLKDPRFPPVTAAELPELVYSVDVLAEPEQVTSMEELDVKRYGVIVQSGERRGLLLPDLEGVDTVAEQVAIARRKGGIAPQEKVTLWRFAVTRYR